MLRAEAGSFRGESPCGSSGRGIQLVQEAFEKRAQGSKDRLETAFRRLPYELYAPMRLQLLGLLRAVNSKRKVAGLPSLDRACVRLSWRIVRRFV